jgi:hypothetical protein
MSSSKSNPLFVDSTKFHGDSIGTQVELKNVMVFDGEELLIVITNHNGVALRIPMKLQDERTFEARVHLNHQKSITYQFVIEKDGVTLLSSRPRRSRAQYAIIEDWRPDLGYAEASPAETATADARQDLSWPKEYAGTVKSLIDKWGL